MLVKSLVGLCHFFFFFQMQSLPNALKLGKFFAHDKYCDFTILLAIGAPEVHYISGALQFLRISYATLRT